MDGLQRVSVRSRRGEVLSEEVVAATFANLSSNRRVEDGVDRQRQRNHAVATVDGLQRVAVSACSGKILPEEVVAASLADFSINRCVEDRVDRQGQRNHAVATMDGLQRVSVRSRRGEILSEEVVAATFANLSSDRRVEDRVDRQRQGDDTVAAVDGLQRVSVRSRRGEVLSKETVAAAFANLSGNRGVEDGVDRQRQRNHAVAAVDGLQGVGVRSRRGEVLSEEVVAAAVADFSGNRGVEDGVDYQGQCDHTVATVDGLQRVGVSACSGKILSEEVVASALANRSSDRRVDDIIDRQGQRNHAVATMDGLQRVGVRSSSGKILSEEVVTAAFANLSGDRGVEDGVDC